MKHSTLSIIGRSTFAGLAVLSTVSAFAETVATHSAPTDGLTLGGLFQVASVGSLKTGIFFNDVKITGGYSGSNLTLKMFPPLGAQYPGTKFTVTPMTADFVSAFFGKATYSLDTGVYSIDYTTTGGKTFDIGFTDGKLTIPNTGLSSLTASIVSLTGTALGGFNYVPGSASFSYAFTNPALTGTNGIGKYNAALDSSATPVPEPFTMVLGCMGAGAYLRKRASNNN